MPLEQHSDIKKGTIWIKLCHYKLWMKKALRLVDSFMAFSPNHPPGLTVCRWYIFSFNFFWNIPSVFEVLSAKFFFSLSLCLSIPPGESSISPLVSFSNRDLPCNKRFCWISIKELGIQPGWVKLDRNLLIAVWLKALPCLAEVNYPIFLYSKVTWRTHLGTVAFTFLPK